jgi:rhodanese-related sulfurtransferase
MFPDPNTEIILYCRGGFRSVLTAEAAQKMGYQNVFSVVGGWRAVVQANWPRRSGE